MVSEWALKSFQQGNIHISVVNIDVRGKLKVVQVPAFATLMKHTSRFWFRMNLGFNLMTSGSRQERDVTGSCGVLGDWASRDPQYHIFTNVQYSQVTLIRYDYVGLTTLSDKRNLVLSTVMI